MRATRGGPFDLIFSFYFHYNLLLARAFISRRKINLIWFSIKISYIFRSCPSYDYNLWYTILSFVIKQWCKRHMTFFFVILRTKKNSSSRCLLYSTFLLYYCCYLEHVWFFYSTFWIFNLNTIKILKVIYTRRVRFIATEFFANDSFSVLFFYYFYFFHSLLLLFSVANSFTISTKFSNAYAVIHFFKNKNCSFIWFYQIILICNKKKMAIRIKL